MKSTVRILGIIPARGGSKRIPRKNIARLVGQPMIAYTIRAAAASKTLDACIVSTDDPAIARAARSLGADAPFLRPKKYARDASRDIGYARHALQWLERHRGWRPEIVALLPPDCPLRTGADIDRAVRLLIKGDYDSVRTIVRPAPRVPYKAMWRLRDRRKNLIVPLFPQYVGKASQDVPDYYVSVGMAYVTRAKYILRGTLWGPRVGGLLMDDARRCIEIDEPEQLRQAEEILLAAKKNKKRA